MEEYLKRIDVWIQANYGKSLVDDSLRLPSKSAAEIFVNSMIDPQPQERTIEEVE